MVGGIRIGFDIGGTFTDFVLQGQGTGRLITHKRLTTLHNPAEGALEGLATICSQAGVRLADVSELVHGTTLVTNALIERRGSPTGLITTRGFRDALEMGTEQRYDIFDLFARYPEPLVPREWRLEVGERIDADGGVVRPLDPAEVLARGEELVSAGVQAIAIVFVHAYRNPEHEREARRVILERWPGLAVSISSEVAPEIREYQRTSTTVANAYVQPVMARYLDYLAMELERRGFGGRLLLMHSGGGLVLPEEGAAFPIRLLESGPAGGAEAAGYMASLAGHRDLLAFDMGGTTAKACLIREGRPDIAFETEIGRVHRLRRGSGLPVRIPTIDMIEIGAGGGSIASVDSMGLLQVGPRSAGASPGPACYGQGGADPTVTDANLMLGYLNPDFFLGGKMRLETEAAVAAIERLAGRIGQNAIQTAWGVYSIVCENMAAAVRTHIVEKGQDPRRFLLVAFGGAGPACAVWVARIIGCQEVLVPWATGAASALGFLLAPPAFEVARSHPVILSEANWDDLNLLLEDLEERARERLRRAGLTDAQMRVERFADMRLKGQVHDIRVPVPDGKLTAGGQGRLVDNFVTAYERLYSRVPGGIPVQVFTWRAVATGDRAPVTMPAGGPVNGTRANPAPAGFRNIFAGQTGGFVRAAVYSRYDLKPGDRFDGPAVVEEREATTVIAPGDTVVVEESLALRILIGKAGISAAPATVQSGRRQAP